MTTDLTTWGPADYAGAFLFTWGLGLAPAILIRYVVPGAPIATARKAKAIVITLALFNFILFSILTGSPAGHAGPQSLVAMVGYFILRRGADKTSADAEPGDRPARQSPRFGVILGTTAIGAVVLFAFCVALKLTANGSPARATASAVAVPTAHTKAVAERWPAVFGSRAAQPEIPDLRQLSLGDSTLNDLSSAYGFCVGQRLRMEVLAKRHSAIAASLREAQTKFDLRYGQSFDVVSAVLQTRLPAWSTVKDVTTRQLTSKMSGSSTDREAVEFLAILNRRVEGDLPSPMAEVLTRFNPRYLAQPATEWIELDRRVYTNDDAGLRFSVEYPASWRARDGRQPHVVQAFTSGRGVMMTISVTPLPSEAIAEFRAGGIETLNGSWEDPSAHVVTLDSGQVTLAGWPTIWAEYTAQHDQLGINVSTHALAFIFVEGDQLVHIGFSGASSPAKNAKGDQFAQIAQSLADADITFQRNGKLFQFMLNSFTVQR
jgi:hypothetical protein